MPSDSVILLLIDFIQLILALITLILSFRIVLRVEKKLDTFFKLLTLAALFVVVREFLYILDYTHIISAEWLLRPLEVLPLAVIVVAYVVMNGIVMKLDKER